MKCLADTAKGAHLTVYNMQNDQLAISVTIRMKITQVLYMFRFELLNK